VVQTTGSNQTGRVAGAGAGKTGSTLIVIGPIRGSWAWEKQSREGNGNGAWPSSKHPAKTPREKKKKKGKKEKDKKRQESSAQLVHCHLVPLAYRRSIVSRGRYH
jgi:hypothetical protein